MKNKFLKELEKKLSVLSLEEKEDIIDEYSDIIDEKIKHGKTEEEAIKEFGDVSELAKEILKAYKINPDYKEESSTKKIIEDGENIIKKIANKLTEFTDKIVDSFKNNDQEFTTSAVFELIIKIFLVLICLAFLKLPFYILSELGMGIFSIGFYPFSTILSAIWQVLIEIIYLVVCGLLIISVVNNYTNKKNKEKKKKVNNKKSTKEVEEPKKQSGFSDFVITLIRVWTIILILVPIWLIEIAILISLGIIVYCIIKGLEVFGILVLVLGIFGITCYFGDLVWKLLFNKKDIHLYPIFINIVLITIGGLMTFDYVTTFTFKNEAPVNVNFVDESYTYNLEKETIVPYDSEIIVDNNLENNKLIIKINYCSDFYVITKPVLSEDSLDVIYTYKNDFKLSLNNSLTTKIFDNLRDRTIYNYGTLDNVKIKIYVNEQTKNLLIKNKFGE